MKTLLYALIYVLTVLASSGASAQDSTKWARVSSLNVPLKRIAYLSGDTIYCKGAKLYRTFNGGETWDSLPIPFYGDMAFRDASTGLLLGVSDVLKTLDGGQTWTPHSAGINVLHRIRWIGHDTVFVSTDGAVCRSTDAGETWTVSGGVVGGWDISFRDSKVGALCGDREPFPGHPHDEPYSGQLEITANGGEIWSPVFTGIHRTLRTVAFLHPDVLLIGSEGGMIYRTLDRGQTWDSTGPLQSGFLQSMRFLDPRHGITCGGSIAATTEDAGQTWTQEYIPGIGTAYDASLVNDSTAYAVGNGFFVRYGGVLRVVPEEASQRRSIHATVSANHGVTLSGTSDASAIATVRIFNIDAVEEINTQQQVLAGNWTIPISLSDKPSGAYVYEITINGERYTGKLTLTN